MHGNLPLILEITDEKEELLRRLAAARRTRLGLGSNLTLGARIADAVAATVGSWPFIIIQSCLLTVWITLNLTAFLSHWDPYPFILLNLVLSFQAAYAAPIIMMSQNRQASVDRAAADQAYDIDVEAELEIELLHNKIDRLRTAEVAELSRLIREIHGRQPGPNA